jgi:virulence factor Mce-like protein
MHRGTTAAKSRLLGVGMMAGAVVLLILVFHPPTMPWNQPLHIQLQSSSYGNLDKNAGVYLGGVKVGTVQSERWTGGRAVLDLSIEHAYASRVHSNAGATIRPHGLLGPKYVDLDGGSVGEMQDGGTIPMSRVHVTTDVDQVLNSLQPDVQASLKTTLVELAKGSENRGADMNQALASLGESSTQLRTVTDTLQRRDVDLADFFASSEVLNRDLQYAPIDRQIVDTDTVLSGLVTVDQHIGGTIDHTANVLAQLDVVMDGNQQNLGQALQKSPEVITRLRTVLAAGTSLESGVTPSLPYLMTAVMETKSAFSYTDANGHYVKVEALSGPCSTGAPAGCGTPNGQVGPPGSRSSAQSQPGGGAPSAPANSNVSDQQLINMLMTGSGG